MPHGPEHFNAQNGDYQAPPESYTIYRWQIRADGSVEPNPTGSPTRPEEGLTDGNRWLDENADLRLA